MKMTKYKLGELVEVTRGASLSGQFYAEEGKLIRLTLGNFNMNGGGFKENTSKTDLYFTGTVRDEFILNKGDLSHLLQSNRLDCWEQLHVFPKVASIFKVKM